MFLTTDDLVSSIKRRSLAPTSQRTFQDSDFIALMNEELFNSLVPAVLAVREDYFLTYKRTSITALVNHYGIPERAIGNALKDVFLIDANGNRLTLPRVPVREGAVDSVNSGSPTGYFLRGDEVILNQIPSTTSGSIEMWHFARPNKLVATSSCAKITAVSSAGGTTTFTVDTNLSASLLIGSQVDFLNAQSPFLLWAQDIAITAITASTIAVATSSVSDEASTVTPGVNDYICPAQQANIPQLPSEFHPLLAEMVVARVMEALGDMQKLAAAQAKVNEMKRDAISMIQNRVESSPPAALNRNGIFAHLTGRVW